MYSNKLDNSDELDTFLETKPTKMKSRRNRKSELIYSKKIESVITKKSPVPDGFTGEFYHAFKEELVIALLNFPPNLKRREHFLTHSVRPALL